ncbi:MAG: CDP-diacylglycerol--glycerol-3-phosphate 3-phosphatidyltransferase [Actinomycetia bacterium]|nr:CDP-diacylglycerol--glycerol-3-phosphate 3-phosphatidyltransferase [Actinomycetes bacterium]
MTTDQQSRSSRTSTWNVPNILTALRLLMVPLLGYLLLSHPLAPGWRWAAALTFVTASVTDVVDGRIARRYGLVTSFGQLWDPIADKALTGMAFVGLSVLAELPWWMTVVVLLREWGITLLRFLVLKYGVMAANRGGKLKTVTQTVALTGYILPLASLPLSWLLQPVAVVLMWAAVLLTVVTGLDYCWEAWKLRQGAQSGQSGA